MFTNALAVTLTCVMIIAVWLGYQLVLQNGRILLRLEAVERQHVSPGTPAAAQQGPEGLPFGSGAPEFELPSLAGGRVSLSQYRGQWILLIFFNPRCGFCTKMAPDLAGLQIDGNGDRPLPVVVSTGEIEETR